jgi:colanic acid biosynthesis glycosyl transferase WcaI
MRILVFDYSGHPFQVQLSRELAGRGHDVRHVFFAGFQTPKGNLVVQEEDPDTFDIVAVNLSEPFAKNAFIRRRRQEIEIGELAAAQARDFAPDIVVSSNAPLDTQRVLQAAVKGTGAKFVFWLQDIYSAAISRVIPRKFPVVGSIVAAWYRHLEFSMLRASDHIVAITEDFVPILTAKGISQKKIAVIENWAPLDELPVLERDNAWANTHMSDSAPRIVYSGTLGYKHNPALLLDLARNNPQGHVHVYSEGEVADRLAEEASNKGVGNLTVHPWVPFADLPAMLSGADIFVSVIEAEAGVYCVPSKILTYLAIGRPILASVPEENLAARLIARHEAGFVAAPGRDQILVEGAAKLASDSEMRNRLGRNGRAYAQKAFDIEAIGDRFLEAITGAAAGPASLENIP